MDEHLNRALPSLCRDCLADVLDWDAAGRCPACGSPRRVRHPERDELTIAHVDCDAFYAAIEKRDDPGLRDKAVIIGGGRRGVVATACYIARMSGVHSAMPMFKALAACPHAIVVPPDMTKYAKVGRQVRSLMEELTPLVEAVSIDEAFLDLAGTQRVHRASPAVALAQFAGRVESEIGISISIGLSYCKFLAKVASDLDKPRGFAVIGRSEAQAFLAPRPVGTIWGVGKAMQRRLAANAVGTVGDLQRMDEATLQRHYGSEGGRLWRLARGIDARGVDPVRKAKSISAETTFDADIADQQVLGRTLFRLCERVAERLKKQELAGSSITLKLKTSAFELRTVARSGLPPTQLASRIFRVARGLLVQAAGGRNYRLVGVAVSDLRPAEDADRGDLVDLGIAREKATEAAIDRVRAKFGADAIAKGITYDPDRRAR